MDTKHDKVVKREELPPINSKGHSNKCSSEFMWWIKNIILHLQRINEYQTGQGGDLSLIGSNP